MPWAQHSKKDAKKQNKIECVTRLYTCTFENLKWRIRIYARVMDIRTLPVLLRFAAITTEEAGPLQYSPWKKSKQLNPKGLVASAYRFKNYDAMQLKSSGQPFHPGGRCFRSTEKY